MGSDEPEQYRKLFIGGLNYTTTNDSLKEFFEQWGEIVDVVVMKDPQTKRSRGFGFITYSQSSMVDQAMSNRPHKIDGREVETKRAVPRDDIDKPDIAATVKKMFVSGIKEQSEDELHEYFGKFGNITNVTIVTDKDSGQRKGFGFIEYDDTDSVDKAVLIKTHHVAGGKLDVKKAISRSENSGGGGGRGSRGGRGGGGGNRSWGGNPRNDQWGGHHNNQGPPMGRMRQFNSVKPSGPPFNNPRSNGGGYGNSGMGGGYNSGGGYGGGNAGYNSNSGGAWQGGGSGGGAPQGWGNNPAWGNQGGGDNWGSSQTSNNWGPSQSYGGGGGPVRSNYSSNNRSAPYGNPGRVGNGNVGNPGGYGQNAGRRY